MRDQWIPDKSITKQFKYGRNAEINGPYTDIVLRHEPHHEVYIQETEE
jgi:hypothetical protein